MAIELGLNQPLPPGCDERESLNRTRTWLNCFCVDASYAIQFGKIPMIPLNDHLARNSQNWYQSSAIISPFDIHLCAYVDILLVFADFRVTVDEGNSRNRVNEVSIFIASYFK
jgi:transcriptional regulatory protein LEU3